MAKAKREPDAPQMQARLAEAFWSLLETEELGDIKVGDIVSAAACTRGSFYYHYDSRDDFIKAIVRDDFIGRCGLFRFIFNLSAGNEDELIDELDERNFARLSLLMRHGGADIVEDEVKSYTIELWSAVLCRDGEELKPDAREIIEFLVDGLLGMVRSYSTRFARGGESESRGFLRAVVRRAVESVARVQDVDEHEVFMRLEMLGRYRKLDSGHRNRQLAPA